MKLIEVVLWIWLLVLSVIDIKKKCFNRKILSISTIAFGVLMITVCILNVKDWKMVLGGMILGAVFLLASVITRQSIGTGDGCILTVCGMVTGLYQMVVLLVLSLGSASLYGVALCLYKKAGRHTKIPFVPFICLGYGVILICSLMIK
mgnify:FL=1